MGALSANPKVEQLVVCDADAKRADTIKGEHQAVGAIYEQFEVMLEKERPDAVCVVTPDHLHLPHSGACFAAGAHVLQTKPLATNLDDARAIVYAAEESGRKLMVAQERRFRQSYGRMKELIDEGRIGDLIHLRVDAMDDKRRQFERAPWYASAEAGRSALNGTGIHEVDLTRFFVGRPIESVAALSNRLGALAFPKEKTTSALFKFEGDVVGQVTVTYEARWPPSGRINDHLRVLGTEGMIVGMQVYREGEDGWQDLSGLDHSIGTGISGAVNAFVDAVVDGAEIPVTGEDAFDSLAAAEAADRSAAEGVVLKPEALR